MAVNTQFSIAVHVMAGIGYQQGRCVTSAQVAQSVNTSPSFVRRVLAKLSSAGLVHATTGAGGSCRLARDPAKISLLDIYRAVDAPKVFAIHRYREEKACPVSCNIKRAMGKVLGKTQKSMEVSLGNISLSEVIRDVK